MNRPPACPGRSCDSRRIASSGTPAAANAPDPGAPAPVDRSAIPAPPLQSHDGQWPRSATPPLAAEPGDGGAGEDRLRDMVVCTLAARAVAHLQLHRLDHHAVAAVGRRVAGQLGARVAAGVGDQPGVAVDLLVAGRPPGLPPEGQVAVQRGDADAEGQPGGHPAADDQPGEVLPAQVRGEDAVRPGARPGAYRRAQCRELHAAGREFAHPQGQPDDPVAAQRPALGGGTAHDGPACGVQHPHQGRVRRPSRGRQVGDPRGLPGTGAVPRTGVADLEDGGAQHLPDRVEADALDGRELLRRQRRVPCAARTRPRGPLPPGRRRVRGFRSCHRLRCHRPLASPPARLGAFPGSLGQGMSKSMSNGMSSTKSRREVSLPRPEQPRRSHHERHRVALPRPDRADRGGPGPARLDGGGPARDAGPVRPPRHRVLDAHRLALRRRRRPHPAGARPQTAGRGRRRPAGRHPRRRCTAGRGDAAPRPRGHRDRVRHRPRAPRPGAGGTGGAGDGSLRRRATGRLPGDPGAGGGERGQHRGRRQGRFRTPRRPPDRGRGEGPPVRAADLGPDAALSPAARTRHPPGGPA
ncbi:putative UDP-N-acetylmuramoylalanyl-D-glutamate--2,6-diami nopimelate ligase [Actinacidiphila bryophytorum]|uniref:UDP-N-acetylmuramoylalanyl-D-glutamate--2,6-diami nopimelate ligase n=1 Tax=Actinacidiphila bryophytorum TaxID=1436133 RepID=A0A9W4H1Z1_9ACTN|nr:putative UDP-N-acetylmuramoylalanyl-D-glutamate--2,6-diami nopimelate ligase [Actinacidiphila bryophytorum]